MNTVQIVRVWRMEQHRKWETVIRIKVNGNERNLPSSGHALLPKEGWFCAMEGNRLLRRVLAPCVPKA